MTDETTAVTAPEAKQDKLAGELQAHFGDRLARCVVALKEVTIEVAAKDLRGVCEDLIGEPQFAFKQLTDVAGVDYLAYGHSECETDASGSGFGRGVSSDLEDIADEDGNTRFAVVYQLISIEHNRRLRVRVYLDSNAPIVPSVTDLYPSANWAEREAFDLFGILFEGHPDLRRILTDYGFIGHPFRKDFPLTGHVEVRYDADKGRVEYVPTEIVPRTLVPKVIRAASDPADQVSSAVNEDAADV